MKKSKRILTILLLAAMLVSVLCVPAFALTESEVEAAVETSGKEAVTGNVFIWFLCAMAFLKIAQKIDSIMAALGVNVGRPGGSMLAEAMVAMRAVTMVVRGGRGTGSASGSAAGKSGDTGMTGFFKGGLIGMAGRHITNSAVKTATTQTSAVHTVQNQARQAAAAGQAASDAHVNSEVHMGGASVHTENNGQTGAPSQDGVILTGSEAPLTIPADPTPQGESTSVEAVPVDLIPPDGGVVITGGDTTVQASQTENTSLGGPEAATEVGGEQVHTERVQTSHTSVSSEKERISHFQSSGTRPTLGGMIFSRSLEAGGSFANDVIGTVARGEVAGSITGDMAAQSLQSYLGYTAQGSPPPIFTDAEIGGGRITGQVSTPDYPQPIAFGLYHTEQYMEPKGEFTKIRSADGTLWYSQLAQDTVERKPYQAPDGTVAYKERIVKKLPDPPKRKDRV